MSSTTAINRRDFLKLSTSAGIGLVLGFCLPTKKLYGIDSPEAVESFAPNVWLAIDRSGTVTITFSRCEMGQKIWTSLPMIVAEELEADWSKVRIKQGDFNRAAYGSQTTGGSASVRTSYNRLRRAGAVAREMLISAAAQTWKVPVNRCRAENGTVINLDTKQKLKYGELTELAAQQPIPDEVPLKDPKDFKIIGQSLKSLNADLRVNGKAVFGLDFKLPGLLTAVIARCPVIGGKVANFDDSITKTIPGVRHVVEVTNGVAVVADDTWTAIKGRKALKITWDEGPNANLSSEIISETLKNAVEKPGTVLRDDGNVEKAEKESRKKITADFEVPYLDHAPMEPMNCTAYVHENTCEIWAPTQRPSRAHRIGTQVTGLDAKNVIVHILPMGGAFGRRLQYDYVRDAVEVSNLIKAPVKVLRTRDEDIQHGTYRPATYHRVSGSLDKNGYPLSWNHRVSGPGPYPGLITGGADTLAYDIPNIHVDYVMSDISIPTGAWRSVANTQNAFVNECFIDELAVAAGKDPYLYRRKLLEIYPRMVKVLDLVAEKAHWGNQPKGHFQGIAIHPSFHSRAAIVVELNTDKRGGLNIHKVVCAIDCGLAINPDGVKAQLEGGIILALTAALYGAITLKNGRVQQSNFHNYKLLTMRETPLLETYIVDIDEPPTGVGEPPVPPTPPALANAIFAATGKRIRTLPVDIKKLRRYR